MKTTSKDKAAPKGKTTSKDKAAKQPGPKLVAKDITPGIGHNGPHTGERNPEAVKCLDELLAIQVQKKALGKAERDVRNRFKTEFGILASSVSRELALRKLDTDVRVQVETNHEDLKKMLGYQPSLDFTNGVATTASAKAQPSEAELEKKQHDTEPKREPKAHATFTVPADEEEEEIEEDDSKLPGGVISREG